MNWNEVSAIAAAVSTLAFVTTAVVVTIEVRSLGKSRYLQISSELFSAWQSRDFMDAQLWLIHRMNETTWEAFINAHRADYGEQAFHRVGALYDRVGTLVRLGLVDRNEIITTIGPYAIAVWTKIEPLVKEARRAENSTLFADFERIMPACYECYVPNIQGGTGVTPFMAKTDVPKISVESLRRRMERGEPIVVIDARKDPNDEEGAIPGAIRIAPDAIADQIRKIPSDREVIVYCS